MHDQRLEKISAGIDRLAFALLIALGSLVAITLLFSVGDPKPEIAKLKEEHWKILDYVSNTAILLFLSLLIQTPFFFFGTMYVRRLGVFAKIALILPFATGTIAPAVGFYTLLSPQIGPLETSWFTTDIVGVRLLISLIDAWQWTGILLFLAFAYIERIPLAHFQQATLEGISRMKQWRLIVWPAVRRMIAIYIGIKALDWIRKFEVIKSLFGDGGPDEVVKTFAMYSATRNFDAGTQSYASALALIQLVILLVCVFAAFRTSAAPKDIGRIGCADRRIQDHLLSERVFWMLLSALLLTPVLWLLSMSFQPTDAIFRGGFKFLPETVTLTNYLQFTPWGSSAFFSYLIQSIAFYVATTIIAIIFALNETYRLTVHSSATRERRHFATIIAIFFLPAFAVFNAIQHLKSLLPFEIDLYALFVVSAVSGYALGFAALYMTFKFGFRRVYEQCLLEFGSPALAFWCGVIWPQIWIVCVSAVLVHTIGWNELFLSDKWTSGTGWRPFAVVISMGIEQYRLHYSELAAGAAISMATPIMLGLISYLGLRIVVGGWHWSRLACDALRRRVAAQGA